MSDRTHTGAMNGFHSHTYRTVKKYIIGYRRTVLAAAFLLEAALANYFAFVLRFDSIFPADFVNKFLTYLPLLLVIRFCCYLLSGLHKGMWRYASISDMLKIVNSATLGSIIFIFAVNRVIGDIGYPRSIYVLDLLLFVIMSGATRLFIRVFREYALFWQFRKRILIIGTGDAGEMVVREMKNNHESGYEPIGFIDDDADKKGLTIHGFPILGSCSMLPEIIRKNRPDEILISVSTDAQKIIRTVYEICKPFNIPIKKMPEINDLLDGKVSIAGKMGQLLVEKNVVTEDQIQAALDLQKKEGGRLGSKLIKLGFITEEKLIQFLNKQKGIPLMQPISLVDLLQRDPVNTDIVSVKGLISGKAVLVTGAGGSIGSELCRQIIKYRPSHLLLFDRYENSMFSTDIELRGMDGDTRISTIVGDVQDPTYLEHIFSNHKPQIIFHAAAYKHVPLMEHNPIEAVKNNIFGTKNVIDAASRHCAENFVLISTDKAVNPTSVMGVTKRIAEFLTVNMNATCKTKFTAVRFGNVLGTNGSVVPIFKEQVKNGGPVTVTHPQVKRFFMMIPEAVQLVLTAAAAGRGGEIFVLDMGSPIKILDLAENFIRLAGFIPHKEIKIAFTGLRPGEKLYEDLFDESEKMIPTPHEKLMIALPQIPSPAELSSAIADLTQIVQNYSLDEVVPRIRKIVPSFKRAEHAVVCVEGAEFVTQMKLPESE